MSVSVIIPAHNEEPYLQRTIDNVLATATGQIEVIAVLDGYNQEVRKDPRVSVIRYTDRLGERVAMNTAANVSEMTHLLRIDAHCDFSPVGWDQMMESVTPDGVLTQAVLTAIDIDTWKRIPGHRYERCRLLPTMEAKWHNPNRSDDQPEVIANMSSTGCGMMVMKQWYDQIGGADEHLPAMGAIGEEFSIKTWFYGGRCQTATQVMIGHIFGTNKTGYPTDGVRSAQEALVAKYGSCYEDVRAKFPDMNTEQEAKLKTTHHNKDKRIVTVTRTDTEVRSTNGQEVLKIDRIHKYKWIDDGSGLTDAQVEAKYKDRAVLVEERQYIKNAQGQWVQQAREAVTV
jgi:cellulose synthase/poly-beta-1,6-N-acetylglucosamine synthase-like glycosyltransferase